jgi:phage FluMu protein Com
MDSYGEYKCPKCKKMYWSKLARDACIDIHMVEEKYGVKTD